jgi:tetratricopeptide (TPR) repeat protein
MPLAIELAAAQLRLLSLAEICAGIESSLDVLETSLRGRSARHRSMRAVFETSWDGLEPAERRVFARLSVFRGGFSMEAADQVAGAALRELAGLVDKSLIGRTADGRFSVHPLVQRFAGYKLAEMPDEPARTQGCHFDYFRALATQAAGEWERTHSRVGLEALRPEVGNVRAAWRWALNRRDWAALSEVTDALWTFYRVQGRLTEAMELPERALAEGAIGEPPADSDHLAHWECRLGQGRLWLSQMDEADRHFRRMLAALGWPVPAGRVRTQLAIAGQLVLQALHRLWPAFFIGRQAGRQAAIGEAYIAYGNLVIGAVTCNETLLAVYYTVRALNLAEAGGRPALMSPACAEVGYMFFLGSAHSVADFYVRRAQALAGQEVSDDAQAWTGYALGWYFFCLGAADQAGVQFDLSADAAARLEQGWNLGNAWIGQMWVYYYLGQYQKSLGYALQVRESGQRRGDLGFIAEADCYEAVLKLQWGRLEEAQADLGRSAAAPAGVMNPYVWMTVWTALARIYLRQGRLDLAVREADRFTRMIDENPSLANPLFIYGFAGAAAVYLAAWEAAGGARPQRWTRPEERAAQKTCRMLEKAARTFPYGRASARLYRGCYEWLNGRPREAHRAWAEALTAARKLGFPYEEGLAHYEIGRHIEEAGIRGLGDSLSDSSQNPQIPAHWGRREHLERAAEIFARLEIPYELNLCRAAQSDLKT